MTTSKGTIFTAIPFSFLLCLTKFLLLLPLLHSNIHQFPLSLSVFVPATVIVVGATLPSASSASSSSSSPLLATTRRKPFTTKTTALIDSDNDLEHDHDRDLNANSLATSSSATTPPPSSERSTFHQKFETYGPTLTFTLRNPIVASMSGTGSRIGGNSIVSRYGGPNNGNSNPNGVTSRLAALFRIAPSPYYPSDDRQYHGFSGNSKGSSTSSLSSSASSASMATSDSQSIFREGYMIDDGEIFLNNDEPSSSSSLATPGSSVNTPFPPSSPPFRKGTFANAFHPEIRFRIQSRTSASTDAASADVGEATTETEIVPPFPKSMPWLSSLACGVAWRPFPTYPRHLPGGYGHTLLTSPHHVSCAVKVALPRVSDRFVSWRRSGESRNGGGRGKRTQPPQPQTKRGRIKTMDLGITYRDHLEYPGGTIEILLGKARNSLSPPWPASSSYSDKYSNKLENGQEEVNDGSDPSLVNDHHDSTRSNYNRGDKSGNMNHNNNNHFLIRLATKRQRTNTHIATKNIHHKPIETSTATPNKFNAPSTYLEYLRGSLHLPPPFFLRDKFRKGMCLSPSYDFVDGRARCVLSGEVGSSGRTMAVLRLDAEDSTLTVIRRLDERKIIAPTISLQTGKIVYDWYLSLDDNPSNKINNTTNSNKSNSSIRAHVDPTKGIRVLWTDGMPGRNNRGMGGSCWVTECRIPLGVVASGRGLLGAADIRVGRRWVV